jgi:membrane peptidoglycan carboxypeptidase
MANAYATFANGGVYCSPTAIESITETQTGKKLAVPKSKCERAMSEKTAATLNTLLKGVVEDGTGQQAGLDDRDSAGKTGTTDSRYAAWFVGYTSNLAGAVWVGDPRHSRKMINITIGGVYHAKVFGADTPGPIWKAAMTGALSGTSSDDLPTVAIQDPQQNNDDNGDGDNKGTTTGTTTGTTSTTGLLGGIFDTTGSTSTGSTGSSNGRSGGNGNGNGG